MAVSLTSAQATYTGTTDSSANELLKITLASGVRWIVLHFATNDGKLTHTGTDGAAIGSDFQLVKAGSAQRFYVGGAAWGDGTKDIYVTSATGSTTFYLSQEFAGG